MINPIYQHNYIKSITVEFIDNTNKGIKGLQKDSAGNKKEREGKIVFYSSQDISTLFTRINKETI